jgi:hypothetical protein
VFIVFLLLNLAINNSFTADLKIGTSSVDITPELPVAMGGGMKLRLAETVTSPLEVNVIALESVDKGISIDMAIMVTCDLVNIQDMILQKVRESVQKKQSEIDVEKIFINATHSHTVPVTRDGTYNIPAHGVTQVADYLDLLVNSLTQAITDAWQNRRYGSVTWGLGHAAIAKNRRAVYSKEVPSNFQGNAMARMYGETDKPEFRYLEGYEDHDINMLFFWDREGELIAMTINVAAPAQVIEAGISADYWHPVREALKKKYGSGVCILGWIGAAGEQCVNVDGYSQMYGDAAAKRMRELRKLSRAEEVARRIVDEVVDVYEVVKPDRHKEVQLAHIVDTVALPMRLVTPDEYKNSKDFCDSATALIAENPALATEWINGVMEWNKPVIERFENQKANPDPVLETEIHVLRLGDAVICTNRFELFTDFGIRIKARSKAVQTFVIQLAGEGSYLPTAKAVKNGGYSATVQSNLVGPEGGQVLVDRNIALINSLWKE